LKFFFDTCISIRLVKALRVIIEHQHLETVHLSEKFPTDSIEDPKWLSQLGEEGDWIIISGDPRISRGKAERYAWMNSGLTAFFLRDGWASTSIYNQAADVIRRWPEILMLSKQNPKGIGFLIPKEKPIERLRSI
jgi:hypothetical protein